VVDSWHSMSRDSLIWSCWTCKLTEVVRVVFSSICSMEFIDCSAKDVNVGEAVSMLIFIELCLLMLTGVRDALMEEGDVEYESSANRALLGVLGAWTRCIGDDLKRHLLAVKDSFWVVEVFKTRLV